MLVVDDNEAIRSTCAEILKHYGYFVAEAGDGQEALDKLAEIEVDAVVMDVMMPRKDGISAIKDLTPPPPPPAVILLSAYQVERGVRADLGARVHRVLRKPTAPIELLEAVSEAVEVARSERARE